jgi:predicted RNA-binding Zn ribbon-like protein
MPGLKSLTARFLIAHISISFKILHNRQNSYFDGYKIFMLTCQVGFYWLENYFVIRGYRLAGLAQNKFFFIGNYLCLDFINTQIIQEGQPVDLLESFADLLSWTVGAQLLEKAKAEELLIKWGGNREGQEAFQRALELRVNLLKMIDRILENKSMPQSVLSVINERLRHQVGYAEIRHSKGAFEKRFQADFVEPIQLLFPIADSACDLLCYGDFSLIKKCENRSCILHFYDTTKNHSRRWCSMAACGNRFKAAAHYQRLKAKKISRARNH